MRTTLTLDDDVSARLDRELRKRRVPFETLVNDVLRMRSSRPGNAPALRDHGLQPWRDSRGLKWKNPLAA